MAEEENLRQGVKVFGKQWVKILHYYNGIARELIQATFERVNLSVAPSQSHSLAHTVAVFIKFPKRINYAMCIIRCKPSSYYRAHC